MNIYKHIQGGDVPGPGGRFAFLAKSRVSLPDRPGSLAGFASTIAQAGGNITFFHYDRSLDSSRVVVEPVHGVPVSEEPALFRCREARDGRALRDHR